MAAIWGLIFVFFSYGDIPNNSEFVLNEYGFPEYESPDFDKFLPDDFEGTNPCVEVLKVGYSISIKTTNVPYQRLEAALQKSSIKHASLIHFDGSTCSHIAEESCRVYTEFEKNIHGDVYRADIEIYFCLEV